VGRPSKWTGSTDHHGNWEDILAKYMSGELVPQGGGSGAGAAAAADPQQQQQQPPTRIVELRNMVTRQDLADDGDYADIVEDTQQECSQFGQLVRVVIPRGGAAGAGPGGDPRVYLEYSTPGDAASAVRALQGRTFDGRQVQASYYDEDKFSRQEYGGGGGGSS
jgi:splicing factor U2AF subunit